MIKLKLWPIIIMMISTLIMVGFINQICKSRKSSNEKKESMFVDKNNNEPNYKTDHAITYIYNSLGKLTLNYKIITDEIHHFSQPKISWFIHPTVINYDFNGKPIWSLCANKAKLTKNNIIYLYDNIQLNFLHVNFAINKILMQNAIINLINKDIYSYNKVILIGKGLRSIGMKMHSNMHTRTTELMEEVETYYYNNIPNKNNPTGTGDGDHQNGMEKKYL